MGTGNRSLEYKKGTFISVFVRHVNDLHPVWHPKFTAIQDKFTLGIKLYLHWWRCIYKKLSSLLDRVRSLTTGEQCMQEGSFQHR